MLSLTFGDLGCEVPNSLRDRITRMQADREVARKLKASAEYAKRRAHLAVAARKRNSLRKNLSKGRNFGYKSHKKMHFSEAELATLADTLSAEQARIADMSQVQLQAEFLAKGAAGCPWGWKCECEHIIKGNKTVSAIKQHCSLKTHLKWAVANWAWDQVSVCTLCNAPTHIVDTIHGSDILDVHCRKCRGVCVMCSAGC